MLVCRPCNVRWPVPSPSAIAVALAPASRPHPSCRLVDNEEGFGRERHLIPACGPIATTRAAEGHRMTRFTPRFSPQTNLRTTVRPR